MPLRVDACPNCNHAAVAHEPLDVAREAHCAARDGAIACACPLDRAAANLAIAVAASLVKYG